jgi:hypothetical protein
MKLISILSSVEGVEQPQPTFNIAGTQSSRERTCKDAVFALLYGGKCNEKDKT